MRETKNYLSEAMMHRRRRRARSFVIGVICVVVLVLTGTLWLFASSPLFQIQRIDITGNSLVSGSDIGTLLRAKISSRSWEKLLLGSGNILAWPDKLIASSDLVFYPAIKGIEISKHYFRRTVSVKVSERVQVGIWCYESPGEPFSGSSCWRFDDEGILFGRSPSAEGNLIPIVKDFSGKEGKLNSKILPDRFTENLLSIIYALQKNHLNEKEMLIKNPALEEVEVFIDGGPVLYFSLRFSADNISAALPSFFEKHQLKGLQYIDFRVEDKIYFK